jgi:ankyrin repeat protein
MWSVEVNFIVRWRKNMRADLLRTASRGDIFKVKRHLTAEVDVDRQCKDGKTALIYASYNSHREVVRLLIAAGAEVITQCNK